MKTNALSRLLLSTLLLAGRLSALPIEEVDFTVVVVTSTIVVPPGGVAGGQDEATPTPSAMPEPIIELPDVNSPSSTSSGKDELVKATGLPRLAIYYQTTHDQSGRPISMLPLVTEKGIALTHLIVCTFHVQADGVIHLNDFPPGNARFSTVWEEVKVLKASGIKVIGMVGGAAVGSFTKQTLDAPDGELFEKAYKQLHDAIEQFGLEGMDLDVEQDMSQSGITRLVRRLRADFGADFIITLAPVATALLASGRPNLSGFNYKTLEAAEGSNIQFYNAQFYNGFGDMSTTTPFDNVVANGFDPKKVLVGQITSPANGGQFVAFDKLKQTVTSLVAKHGQIGGIMGWEYFNSRPGDTARPWEWAQEMTKILRPDAAARLTVTREEAQRLTDAWVASFEAREGGTGARVRSAGAVEPDNVDYWSMVNA